MSVQGGDSFLRKDCLHSQTALAEAPFKMLLLFNMQIGLHGDAQHCLH